MNVKYWSMSRIAKGLSNNKTFFMQPWWKYNIFPTMMIVYGEYSSFVNMITLSSMLNTSKG